MTSEHGRIEYDSMGPVELPAGVLYGPQTQRAVNNFTIHPQPMPWEFIVTVILIKQAAAEANMELGLLDQERGKQIVISCEQLTKGELRDQFPVSVYQTGSGTSTNMNVNEVISSMAKAKGVKVSPNDHVNLGQSSNDVIPAAVHIATAIEVRKALIPATQKLADSIRSKAAEYSEVIKTGRTHLMDALPIRVQAEFEAWALQIEESSARLQDSFDRLTRLPLGGTAIGSGVNCHPDFAATAITYINEATGIRFAKARSLYKGISSMDTALEVSSHLKTLAMSLMKIANDLRWMNSGPLSGIGEIVLPALQPGSSIMPAKVNPVIPEAVAMAAAQVAGYDLAVTFATQSGNFQLNTMLPLIAANLLASIELLTNSCYSLAEKVFDGLVVKNDRCLAALEKNPILVTALNPEIGYLRAAELAKIAVAENRTILDVALEHTDLSREKLENLLDPKKMADGGNS
ncbi:class II fumarate hydratase [Desulfopila aestuarii]|uniref:Fumarase, class II n=1 Tax=Desulfopila aestuarii DSM 18488 TaxID=1121416 RepID=A0A1M7YCD5_9BACT|nr:class II fumarate hydratase [Desulfopila aestuarii]SHO50239.1 fumarase, class II [Desulfopila aestuarii DSM 18488]